MNKLAFSLSLLVVMYLTGCDDNSEQPDPEPVQVTAQQLNGTYTITSFVDDGSDIIGQFGSTTEMEIFTNQDIFFKNTAVSGSWTFGDDQSEIEISIDVDQEPFNRFEDDWVIVRFQDGELWLQDDDLLDDDSPDDDDDIELVKLQKQP